MALSDIHPEDFRSGPVGVSAHTRSILQEAEAVVTGPRAQSYGDAVESFTRIAKVWSVTLDHEVTPRDVARCMIGLKLCRDSNKAGRDNLVDIAGYAALAHAMDDEA